MKVTIKENNTVFEFEGTYEEILDITVQFASEEVNYKRFSKKDLEISKESAQQFDKLKKELDKPEETKDKEPIPYWHWPVQPFYPWYEPKYKLIPNPATPITWPYPYDHQTICELSQVPNINNPSVIYNNCIGSSIQ